MKIYCDLCKTPTHANTSCPWQMEKKEIEGFENYIITSDGIIFNKTTGHTKKHSIDHKGYYRVSLYDHDKQHFRLVSRLLAQAFIPNPENKPIVHHIDGNVKNNTLSNLMWATASENVQDGFNRGRRAWNKGMRSIETMTLLDLAEQLPRLQKESQALWGEDKQLIESKTYHLTGEAYKEQKQFLEAWQYKLQQMVIAEDPISYLGANI